MKEFNTICCVIMLVLSVIGSVAAIILDDVDMGQNALLALITGHCICIEGKLDKEEKP